MPTMKFRRTFVRKLHSYAPNIHCTIHPHICHGSCFHRTFSCFRMPSATFLALTTQPSKSGIPRYAYDPHIQMPGTYFSDVSDCPCNSPSRVLLSYGHCHHFLDSLRQSELRAALLFIVTIARSSLETLNKLSFLGGMIGFVVWNTRVWF